LKQNKLSRAGETLVVVWIPYFIVRAVKAGLEVVPSDFTWPGCL